MAALAELLPLVREWGARPARLSDDRPLLPLGHLPDSDSNVADSCPTVTVTLEGCFPVGHLTPPQQNGYLPPRLARCPLLAYQFSVARPAQQPRQDECDIGRLALIELLSASFQLCDQPRNVLITGILFFGLTKVGIQRIKQRAEYFLVSDTPG